MVLRAFIFLGMLIGWLDGERRKGVGGKVGEGLQAKYLPLYKLI